MDKETAVSLFESLSSGVRLDIVRLLVRAAPDGCVAGQIATTLGVPSTNLSFHLKALSQAALVMAEQEGRYVRYRANLPLMFGLIAFLTAECCTGVPTDSNETACGIDSLNSENGMSHVTIYHNPDCGTSRNTLGLIRNTGVEPNIIEYLKTPPSRETLIALIDNASLTVREAIRQKGTPYLELGLDNATLSDDQLLDAMLKHPILINRPFVKTPEGVRLCRPSEMVLDILAERHLGSFTKEDGEMVIDDAGNRVR